jgi:hypothetical protein
MGVFDILIPASAGLAILLIAIVYMLGRMLRIPALEAYFTVELYNLVLVFLFLGALITAYYGLRGISSSILGGAPIDVSQKAISECIYKAVFPMYMDMLRVEAGATVTSSFYLRYGPGVWSNAHKVRPGVDALVSISRLMSFGLLSIYASLSVQYILHGIIDFAMPIVFSLGTVLMIFGPTRQTGCYMMALGYGFHTVFPMVYGLGFLALDDMGSTLTGGAEGHMHFFNSFESSWLSVFFSSYNVPFLDITVFSDYFESMAYLAVVSLFLPALASILTISSMTAVVKLLNF